MEQSVKKSLGTTVFKATGSSGGGCISSGSSYITDNGIVFVKINNKPKAELMFEGEKAGLEAILATGTIKCPKPIKVVKDGQSCALIMESLTMKSMSSQQQFQLGEQLARMHLHNKNMLEKSHEKDSRVVNQAGDSCEVYKPVEKFGFDIPTSCGYIPQDNTWQSDWTSFYVEQKLQAQVDMILNKKDDRELNEFWPICRKKIESTLNKLGDIKPALVHGDLWSGNVAAVDNSPLIFDPAAFFGHSEYDFGIAKMFGGFSSQFYSGYAKVNPTVDGFPEREIIYELFHHLNHWNHFGSGYRGSTISMIRKISCS